MMQGSESDPLLLLWLRRVAVVILLALPASVAIVRLGWWQQGLLFYALACLLAVVLLALVVVLLLVPRLRAHRGRLMLPALLALPGTVLLASLLAGRGDYPPIHDISTDLDNPPTFTHAPALRGRDANPLAIKTDTQAAQRRAYPDIAPLQTPLGPDQALARARATAQQLDWDVVYEDADDRVIEAVDTTTIMGFKDDVVIRLQPAEDGGTRVDLRSVSRVGVSDLGANAARIRAFQQAFGQGG